MPSDPVSTAGAYIMSTGYNYAYFTSTSSGVAYCGAGPGQMYLLVYRLESSPQTNTYIGSCETNWLGYGTVSNYRVVK